MLTGLEGRGSVDRKRERGEGGGNGEEKFVITTSPCIFPLVASVHEGGGGGGGGGEGEREREGGGVRGRETTLRHDAAGSRRLLPPKKLSCPRGTCGPRAQQHEARGLLGN